MTQSLFDGQGNRKYLAARERYAFAALASAQSNTIAAFCLTLAITGGRISEVLALTSLQIDLGNEAIIFRTLKQRGKSKYRSVPVPPMLLNLINQIPVEPGARIWPWGRTTGWKLIKSLMIRAGIAHSLCKPKALRHAFAVEATQRNVPLNIVQRWLGHARIETTAIYADAMGDEERALAARTWTNLDRASVPKGRTKLRLP